MVSVIDLFIWFSVIYVPLSSVLFALIDRDIGEMKREIRDLEWKLKQIEKGDKSFKQ